MFYVGKGKVNRALAHLTDSQERDKVKKLELLIIKD
ncbi:hypothetical protein [Clostridium estertheticum]